MAVTKNGTRAHSFNYFESSLEANNSNITILCNTKVTKILTKKDKNSNNLIAKSILIRNYSSEYQNKNNDVNDNMNKRNILKQVPDIILNAKDKIILCSGAYSTPHLLLNSGIGDKNDLNKHNIECIKHIPGVGKNLQDHLLTMMFFEVNNPNDLLTDTPYTAIPNLFNWLINGKGPLSCSTLHATAFLRSGLRSKGNGIIKDSGTVTLNKDEIDDNFQAGDDIDSSVNEIDLQYHCIFASGSNADEFDNIFTNQFNIDIKNSSIYKKVSDGIKKQKKYCIICPSMVLPKSVGFVSLRSNDPLDDPIIDPKFLSDSQQYDVECLARGMLIARKIVKNIDSLNDIEVTDDSIKHDINSIDYCRTVSKKIASTIYHPVGTCRMGQKNDPRTVCDETNLLVHGFTNLHVVDCSIMPEIPPGNTNAPAFMIGLYGAEKIANTL